MIWLLLAPAVLYAASITVVAAWRWSVGREAPAGRMDDLPPLAILVAARNEEERLPRCLEALLAQDYPADRLAIYVADDHSTDRTADVVRRFQARRMPALVPAGVEEKPHENPAAESPRVYLVTVPDAQGHLYGKAHAIHQAVLASSQDLILVTDADCAPPPTWARGMAACFTNEDIGIASGPTDVETNTPAAGRGLAQLQALDWSYLLTACAFLVETGNPVTAMGNNMAFRRAAYEAVGGYPALPFSVTEDYVLFRKIVEETRWRARFSVQPAVRNRTLPLPRLGQVYQQRRRWARGGMDAPVRVYALYVLVHLAHLGPLVALFFAPVAALTVLFARLATDLALVAADQGLTRSLRMFPAWAAYLFGYVVTLPAVLLVFPRINWKDRKL